MRCTECQNECRAVKWRCDTCDEDFTDMLEASFEETKRYRKELDIFAAQNAEFREFLKEVSSNASRSITCHPPIRRHQSL
jgi:hypothetical protein